MQLGQLRTWLKGWRALGLGLGLLLLFGLALAWRLGEHAHVRLLLESPRSGRCQRELTRPLLARSLELGAKYMVTHQKPEGNFDYEYDWRADTYSNDDNETRQAGAAWGVALAYQSLKTAELAAATERSLAFFDKNSRAAGDRRCTRYGSSSEGQIGTVALVALAYIEYLRAAPDLAADKRQAYEQRLDEYLQMLLGSVAPSGLWFSAYDTKDCKPHGEPSPYSDGEALLALTKAAKYLGRKQYIGPIMLSAAAGRRLNIDDALEADADSDTTKGYYQWSSMAFYEIATSDFPHHEDYAHVVIELADWMIDEHKVLTRLRNTGYAFEGITHAYALAKKQNDAAHVAKFSCTIDVGLQHLMSWQVGGPSPNRYTSSPSDPRAVGGVQNGAFDSPLRIDVVQHQMHATALALELVYQ
jgi:UDP-N-acetylmuramoyl-tripeptide--D-alanyl-D-alanine ligase